MCASLLCKLLQSLLGGLDQSVEAGGIVDGHLRQHLAVQLDAGLLQAVHEGGVVHTLSTNSVVDAGDPQVAELALLLLTADESVVAALHNGLLGIFYPLVTGHDGGTGLGLSIVQTYVERHGGAIEVDSRPGCTDFSLLFPLGEPIN